MGVFISILKVILPLAIVSFNSIFIIKIIKLSGLIERILLIFILNWCQVLASIQILSLFKAVTLRNVIILHFVSFIVCLILSIIKKVRFEIDFRKIKNFVFGFYKNLKINSFLKAAIIIWLIIMIIAAFIFGITIPPNNYDSMTYHLTRAAFWKQNNSIDHYYSRNFRQLEMPINSEIGFLWIMLFTNSDNILFLIQWSSLIIVLLVLYELLRMFDFKRSVSLLSAFVFISLNMVIFQSSSTQNDLISACFIILVVYFLMKVFKDNNINIRYIIIAGLAAGLAIGTKGYIYLFIPGVLLFIIIFKKNSKLKWTKIAYLIFFSIAGVTLFVSYNLIENYLSFGNIFGSSETINMLRVSAPDVRTFLSNTSKQLASFYQLDYGRGFTHAMIQRALDSLHYILNIDISSVRTTWPGYEFHLYGWLSGDYGYFGPLCSLIIIPSVIYNAILLPIYIKIRNDKDLLKKYKDTLKFMIIPVIFFILYNYIFKWQPWAGRLMISFVLLIMPSFAVFLEYLSKIRMSKIFISIIAYLFIMVLISSSWVMLLNWDYRVLPIGGGSIYSVDYQERRFVRSPPYIREIKKITEKYIPEEGKLGLITSEDDWDYIYFGDNFRRTLMYISEKDYKEKEIQELITLNKLDGIIVDELVVEYLTDDNDLENIDIKISGNYRLYYIP